VFVVPVTPATPATFDLLDSSGPTLLATLTSKGWGTAFNAITVKSEAGKLTVALPGTSETITEIFTYTTVADLVTAINGRSAILAATFVAESTPDTFAATAMAGGTEPAAVAQDWADAFVALNGFRVNAIHVATSDAAIWAMLADYAILHRLRGFVGSDLHNWNGVANRQTAIAALKAEAAALNAPRIMHVGLGADGLPGYLTAARHAALAATLEPSVPMTFKHLDFTSLETRLDYYTEVGGVDGLLLAGVAVPVPDPSSLGTFLVSRGLSTWTGDDNLYRREQSVLAAMDAVQDLIEAGMRQFLGGEGKVGVIARAVGVVDTILRQCTQQNSAVRINSYRPESIVAQFSSDTVLRIRAAVTPIPPINFIDVSLNLERTEIELDMSVNLAA